MTAKRLPKSDIKKVFVAGAAGETGRKIVQDLLDLGVEVRAGVRDPATVEDIVPKGAILVKADVTDRKFLEAAIGDAQVVICASGVNYRRPEMRKNPVGPYQIDYLGTKNLIDIAKEKGVTHFVLVTSLCVSKIFHPLNLFFGVLFWKKRAENYLIKSGLTYTIVRPGGLLSDDNSDSVVATGADTVFEGRIPRAKVAKVVVESLYEPDSYNKIVEIVGKPDAEKVPIDELFAKV
eukprot:CAMPEP_0196655558 /NCGR_PEP_ID=MMETSP1086-20130531/5309_1 /TAXON_ID=77921 /ORGANISM="Cyanoptyche  gloeocystis , Strain SAG4.97" /LENGTH=234 /DNA_ID=CAMNT_0041987933 /DNA_START=285 /DNA_END=989 /DNA_ORIENTATION=-